jgi:hypothetical protein
MSLSGVSPRGPGGCTYRSPGGARGFLGQGTNSLYSYVVAAWPICGFGTFANTGPFDGTLLYNDIWPNVYSTLTETWGDDASTGCQIPRSPQAHTLPTAGIWSSCP